jgi:hypothetical protein
VHDRDGAFAAAADTIADMNIDAVSTAPGEDRTRLRPLKIAPTELALRIPVSVSPTGVVMHEGHPYSMPPDAIGLPGTLYLYRDRVRIIAGRFSADHERQFQPGPARSCPSIAPSASPRSPANAPVATCSVSICLISAPRRSLSHRADASPPAHVDSRSRAPARLLQTHGDGALRTAFDRGLAEQAVGAEYIGHYLGFRLSGGDISAIRRK